MACSFETSLYSRCSLLGLASPGVVPTCCSPGASMCFYKHVSQHQKIRWSFKSNNHHKVNSKHQFKTTEDKKCQSPTGWLNGQRWDVNFTTKLQVGQKENGEDRKWFTWCNVTHRWDRKRRHKVIHDSNTKPEKLSPESVLNFIGIDPIPRATFHLAVCFKRVMCVLCECTEWAVRRQKNKGPLHS